MIVYLAGAVADVTQSGAFAWRAQATEDLAKYNIKVLNPVVDGIYIPHTLYIPHTDVKPPDELCARVFNGDFDMIERSTHFLFNASVKSDGSAMEALNAFQLEIPIVTYGLTKRMSPFIQHVTTHLVDTYEEAIECLRQLNTNAATTAATGTP